MRYKNILLIDDDQDDAEIFTDAIQSLERGILVQSLFNSVLAFEELKNKEQLPDLILLDYNMPALNGYEFLQKMKANERLQNIPVIMISTPTDEFILQAIKTNDLCRYFSKPNSYHELVDILSGIL
jgi:PleD family two-component response regulator